LRAQGVVHGAPFRHVQIAIELDRFLAGGNRGIDDGQPAGLDERAQPLAGGGAMRRICLDADDAEALREIKRRVLAAVHPDVEYQIFDQGCAARSRAAGNVVRPVAVVSLPLPSAQRKRRETAVSRHSRTGRLHVWET